MAKRDKRIHFLVSKEEEEQIQARMELIGVKNRNAYLRKMALNGYCINLDLRDVKELVSLLRRCSNNLNQYAMDVILGKDRQQEEEKKKRKER